MTIYLMEPSFESFLTSKGVGKNAIRVLTLEKVLSRHIFSSLKEEHIVRLLKSKGMTIGSHAILWDLWETESAKLGEVSVKAKRCIYIRNSRVQRSQQNMHVLGSCQRLCIQL